MKPINIRRHAAFLLLFFLLPLHGISAIFHLGVDAGYSYASMNDMRNGFHAIKDAAEAAGRTAGVGDFGTSVYARMKAVNKVEFQGTTIVPQGQIINSPADESRSADFSGFTGGIGLNFRI